VAFFFAYDLLQNLQFHTPPRINKTFIVAWPFDFLTGGCALDFLTGGCALDFLNEGCALDFLTGCCALDS
jgi:hypothetical protein